MSRNHASGCLTVGPGRHTRIARRYYDLVQVADLSRGDRVPGSPMARIEPTVEANLNGYTRADNPFGTGVYARKRQVDRFFAQHRFARRDSSFNVICMGRRRSCDQHRIHITRRKHGLGALGGRNPVSLRDLVRRRGVDVVYGRETGARVGRNVRGVHPSDPAAAENRNSEHGLSPCSNLKVQCKLPNCQSPLLGGWDICPTQPIRLPKKCRSSRRVYGMSVRFPLSAGQPYGCRSNGCRDWQGRKEIPVPCAWTR